MKTKIILAMLTVCFIVEAQAQNETNTVPETGNVGIGTTNPQAKLQVHGTVVIDSTVTVKDSLRVQGSMKVDGILNVPRIISPTGALAIGENSITVSSAINRIYFSESSFQDIEFSQAFYGLAIGNGSYSQAFPLNSLAFGFNARVLPGAGNSIVMGNTGDASLKLENSIPYSFMIGMKSDKASFFVAPGNGAGTYGKIGIGTTSPEATLDVHLNNSTNGFQVLASNANDRAITIRQGTAGNSTENFLLYGNGKMYCREVFVKLGVLGDFVFDEDYRLMPYGELREYVKVNRHLPGVPPEKEVLAGGLNVGEMQAAVLQKTEENTLYILDLNERLEKAEAENEQLKQELYQLQLQVNELVKTFKN